jgi:hypothetical protein
VCAAWNRVAVRKHCVQTSNLLYICNAEDTVGGSRVELNMEQKVIVVSIKLADNEKTKGTKKLGHRIEIAIGKSYLHSQVNVLTSTLARHEGDGHP